MAGPSMPPALTLDVDPPTPLVCDIGNAFSPLEVSSDERHDDRGGARRSEGLTQRKTLSISKSGTIQIDGFEIRRSGLLATPLKDPRGGGGSVDSGASEDGASADVGAVLSTQLADGGLLSVQDALVPLTVLGRGAGGTVWQAVHVPSLRVVAVKTIPVFEEGRRHQMVRELRALYANLAPLASPTTEDDAPGGDGEANASGGAGDGSNGGCPELVSFYDAYVSPTEGTVSIVQEYMDGGSLQDIVDGGGCAYEAILAHIAHQVLQGLAFLHDRRQIHRDIKPANLLINHRGQVKISDFGLVRHLDSSVSRADTFVGTFTYMSPERICGEEYSYSADVWGLGLTLVTCALGRFPFDHTGGYWGLVSALREMDPPELPANQFSPAFRDFVRMCLAKDPAQRPTARSLLGHAFVRPAAAAAPRIRQLQHQPPQQQLQREEEEGATGGPREAGGASSSSSSSAARAELADVVRAVQSYFRRRWARADHGGPHQGEAGAAVADASGDGRGGVLLWDEGEAAAAAVPNTGSKALVGLARQLGLPVAIVRRAFRTMLRELAAELGGEGNGDGSGC